MKKLFSLIIFLLILISVISPLTIVKGEEINSNQYLILGGAEYVKENAEFITAAVINLITQNNSNEVGK